MPSYFPSEQLDMNGFIFKGEPVTRPIFHTFSRVVMILTFMFITLWIFFTDKPFNFMMAFDPCVPYYLT